MAIQLGSTVSDPITGLSGTAIQRIQYDSDCTQIEVQPKLVKDGTPVKSTFFPEPLLLVGDNEAFCDDPPRHPMLGKMVRHRDILDAEGRVVAASTYLVGAAHLHIRLNALTDGASRVLGFHENELIEIGELGEDIAPVVVTDKQPGGPARSIPMRSL